MNALKAIESMLLARPRCSSETNARSRQPAGDLVVLAHLDQLEPHVAGQQLLVVLHVVGERRAQSPHGDHDDPHDWDTRRLWTSPSTPDRHINIHFSPEIMAGVYANFANVSHSDYEFTITFARVDHEVEEEEIPGVVVSRINLSPKFMRELIDAMQDNYSKWQTREGIKNLPEFGGGAPETTRRAQADERLRRRSARPAVGHGGADPLDRRRVGREQPREPARRVEIGDVLQRDRPLERDERLRRLGQLERELRRRGARPRARAGLPITPTAPPTSRRRQRQRRQRRAPSRASATASSSVAARASAAGRGDERGVGDPARDVAVADVGELVRDDDPHLVAAVAVEQRVEQHHALGRAEPGDVGVGGGRAAARVDRVDLADLDAGRARRARARRSASRPRAAA